MNALQNFTTFGFLVSEILEMFDETFLIHAKFANMSHQKSCIAYFYAKVQLKNFANFTGKLPKLKDRKSVKKLITDYHLTMQR